MRVSKLLGTAVVSTSLLLSSVSGVLYWRDTITAISTDEATGQVNDLTVPLELDEASIQRIDFAHAEPKEIFALPLEVLTGLSDEQVIQVVELICHRLNLYDFQGQPHDDKDRKRYQKLKYLVERHLGLPRARL